MINVAVPPQAGAPAAGSVVVRGGDETIWLEGLPAVQAARRGGVLDGWEELLALDEVATFFQTPAWCLPWYRCYAEEFSPLVLVVRRARRLVGLAPLAVRRTTGGLAFAGDGMTDYRDVVASDEHRASVVAALLDRYRAGALPQVFRVGPLQPDSATARLIPVQARPLRLRTIARAHECWRLRLDNSTDLERFINKDSVRRRLNYFRRQGEVALERLTPETWPRLRQTFFAHHSQRQIRMGRVVAFEDPRKRAFYDALIAEHPESVHLTALRVGQRYVAEHYGYLWRGVLYWGAPAHDVAEERNSPGQVLLAVLIQSAAASGLRTIDFTLGSEEFKGRFGNERVELPTIEVYGSAHRYHRQRLRDAAVRSVKRLRPRLGQAP